LQSGVEVTADSSLQLTAVWRAVNLLSAAVGTLPCKLYQARPGGLGRNALKEDPLYWMLRWQPNPWQTAVDYFEMMQGHLLLRGNNFSRIRRTPLGAPTALVPWHPDCVKIKVLDSGRLIYTLTRPGKEDLHVPQEDMLHVRGPGSNGIVGYSPIALMAQSLGMTFAAQSYGARFFDNNASPSGVLSHPGKLGNDARKNIEDSWRRGYGGRRQHSVALIEDGMTWTSVGVAPEEAQFLETRKFQVAEIARMFGVPPHMLAEMDRATFSNIEQQSLEFAIYSVRPWLIRWEQSIKMVMLDGQRDRTVEFLMDAILRGDSAARAESNATRFMNGTLNIDEWRAGENQNPLPNGEGQTYFVPLNLVPVTDANEGLPALEADTGASEEDEEKSRVLAHVGEVGYLVRAGVDLDRAAKLSAMQVRSAAARHRQLRSFRRLLHRAADKVVRREAKDVMRAVTATDGDPTRLAARLEELYGDFWQVVKREMLPVLRSYAETVYALASSEVNADTDMTPRAEEFVEQYADNMARRHSLDSKGQLGAVIREAGGDTEVVAANVALRTEEWLAKRAGKMAAREAVQANGAVSVNAYSEAGHPEIVWITVGENCTLCGSLDGRTVSPGSNFVDKGSTVTGEGAPPLTARRGIKHPPLHPPNCDCMVGAKI
jgi:HK97 family phage portal protein